MSSISSTAFDRLVDALRNHGSTVKDTGHGRAMAQCPAHDDNRPSLSIRDSNGQALAYCHAGCDLGDVLAAVGWQARDLFDNHNGVTYSYPDGRQVHRTWDKQFRQSGNRDGGALYGADFLTDADTVVFVVEGEKDVNTALKENKAAVSAAMGAGKAHLADWSPLAGRKVIVVADQDEPGRKHAEQVAEIVSKVATEVWIAAPGAGCKDLTDHVLAGHPIDSDAMPFTLYRVAATNDSTAAAGDDADDDGHLVNVRNWADLHDDALQGVAGEIVNAVMPHTEADPAAVLMTLLAVTGAMFGRKPHALAANEQHPARIWPLICGATSNGAKGTSWAVVRALVAAVFAEFLAEHQVNGIVSGEGLIELVQDIEDDEGDTPGRQQADDKRLLVTETEFAAVLKKGARHGSSLMPVVRQAWDGGRLQSSARKDNALVATDPSITIIGHITPGELRAEISEGEVAGGTLNRFLLVRSRRSKLLPDGGNLPADVVVDCAEKVKAAVDYAKAAPAVIGRDEAAVELWRREYPRLVAERPDGWYAAATARAVPQVVRLSVVYAVLDQSTLVTVEHLRAALAAWRYCEASAASLFTDDESDELRGDLSKAAEFIEQQPGGQCTRRDLSVTCFAGHKKAKELDAIVATLTDLGRITQQVQETPGRPRTIYRARTKGTKRTSALTSPNASESSSRAANHANEPSSQFANPAEKPLTEIAGQTLSAPNSPSSQGSGDRDQIEQERYRDRKCIECGLRPYADGMARCAECSQANPPDPFGMEAPF